MLLYITDFHIFMGKRDIAILLEIINGKKWKTRREK